MADRTSKQNVCQYDPLVFGTIQAGFHRSSLGGEPVLTVTDQEAPGEPEVCLDMLEARALRDWLNGVLGAAETSAPLKECPYCKGPARDDDSIIHTAGCLGLERVYINQLEYDRLRGAVKTNANEAARLVTVHREPPHCSTCSCGMETP